MVRNNFCSPPGRPAKAYAFLCVAEEPTTTYEDLQDSGDFERIGCNLASGLTTVLNVEFRYRTKNLTAQEHKAGRMSKSRDIYWTILQLFNSTAVADTMHDFERQQVIRMRDYDLQ
eukprot:8259132-Pyramimonas_sp.AAC.1